MTQRAPFLLMLLWLSMLFNGSAHAAQNDCKWPPLNAQVQRQSNPVQVGGETFTTGFYSYVVSAYHIAALHCAKSINWGHREWAVAIGLGGNEPIGPRVLSNGGNNTAPVPANLPALKNDSSTFTPLPQLPPLTASPAITANALPALAPLPALATNGNNAPLPPLATTAPLPALPPLSP
ncbi:MAG: hypothetical protein JO316_13310 [Abitibacteriaceae bacterium]|nr:hypothetical protein [Abditibacteriaceae bacterium]MBV9866324.1 hypothetical protein [Abditibacteriaceae bacterium]